MTQSATLSPETQDLPIGMRTLHQLLRTEDAWSAAVLRVVLGGVMLPHGLQKTVGLFGGNGFSGTMSFFTETMGLPWLIAFLVIAIELVGAIALILGLGTRLAALGIAAVMMGAVVTVHGAHGFFMNWFGSQAGEGFEYHLLALGMAVALLFAGGGRFSLERALTHSLARH